MANEETIVGVEVDHIDSEPKKRPKFYSKVWKDFDMIRAKDGEKRAQCKRCKEIFVSGSRNGTSYLKCHLRKKLS